jgi:trimeric autotransporter adhesin
MSGATAVSNLTVNGVSEETLILDPNNTVRLTVAPPPGIVLPLAEDMRFKVTPSNATPSSAGSFATTPSFSLPGTPAHAIYTVQVGIDWDANGSLDWYEVTHSLLVKVNYPPVAGDDGDDGPYSLLEDGSFSLTAPGLLVNDHDNDPNDTFTITTVNGNAITGSPFTLPSGATLTISPSGAFTYTPAANFAGNDSFTYKVNDGYADSNTATVSFTVTPVNDPPVGANNAVTLPEGGTYTFTAANFGFSDPNDAPPNAFLAVKISTLPTAGTLTNDGIAVNAGDFVPVTDINAGKLRFTPTSQGTGSPYATFTFQVQDNGGTSNGGVDLDATPRTMTLNVAPINDPPVGADGRVTALEDVDYAFTTADFHFSDPNDSPPNAFAAVKVASLPSAGTLKLNGVPVAAGAFINVSEINQGHFTFRAAQNANGNNYATFTFQVKDDGGTNYGGVDLDPIARTMTIDVTSVNDAPAGTSNTVTTLEDTPYTFTASNFGFSDLNDSPPNAFVAVKIVALPTAGTLTNNGAAVNAGDVIAVSDINANRLVFTPAANANGNAYASFTFKVKDDGGTSNGGVDLDVIARTMTINVTSVNDAPAGANGSVMVLEDTDYVFTANDFHFSDPYDSPPNAFSAVKIVTLPAAGTLKLNGAPVSAGDFINVSDINQSHLTFRAAPNANGSSYANFTFQVKDDGGTSNGGVDLDPTPRTMTINVTSVNDPPVGTDNAVTTPEDIPYAFTTADFPFTDPNDAPPNALAAVQIVTVPTPGVLTNNGNAVQPGSFVSVADLSSDKLVFTSPLNANGTPYTMFTFRVRDDGGTANGGIDLDTAARTMTINVTSVNDAPVANEDAVTPRPTRRSRSR